MNLDFLQQQANIKLLFRSGDYDLEPLYWLFSSLLVLVLTALDDYKLFHNTVTVLTIIVSHAIAKCRTKRLIYS